MGYATTWFFDYVVKLQIRNLIVMKCITLVLLCFTLLMHMPFARGASLVKNGIEDLLSGINNKSLLEGSNSNLDVLLANAPSILPELTNVLENEKENSQLRANAALAIGAIANKCESDLEVTQALPALENSMWDTNPEVRIYSIQAIGAMKEHASGAVSSLIRACQTTNDSIRFCALEALGRIGLLARAAIPELEKGLESDNPDIRATSQLALQRVDVEGAKANLLEAKNRRMRCFKVEGNFEIHLYAPNPKYNNNVTGVFQVISDGCKWKIRTTRADENLDYFEAGSANTGEIYELGSHTNQSVIASKEDFNGKKHSDLEMGFGRMFYGVVPHFNDAEAISILWLAYSSGCYFISRTNNEIEPVYWFGGRYFFDHKLALPAEWSLNKVAPHLPSRVVYFNDGLVRGIMAGGKPNSFEYPEPYSAGFTNAIYSVDSFLSVGQYEVPRSFSLKVYRPMQNGKQKEDLAVYRLFHFNVTNAIVLNNYSGFVPRLHGKTIIEDRRFVHTNMPLVLHYNTESNWPSMNEVEQSATYRNGLSDAENGVREGVIAHTTHKTKRVAIIIVIALNVVVLISVIWSRKLNKT